MGFDRYPSNPSWIYCSLAPEMALAVRQIEGVYLFGPSVLLKSLKVSIPSFPGII